jgi:uncharacterized membrane protein
MATSKQAGNTRGRKSAVPDTAATGSSPWRRLAGYAAACKLEFATEVISVLGLAVSIYMTIEHYTQNSYAGCPANSTFNCGAVTTSPQSYVFGIPVAVLGLAFFLFMVAVNSPWGWRATKPVVHWARLASVIVGMIFVLWLIYAELFLILHICLYCTAVHVLTFILFALVVARAAYRGMKPVPARQ